MKRIIQGFLVFLLLSGMGFGDYGHQEGDGMATITNIKQIQITSEYILKMIRG